MAFKLQIVDSTNSLSFNVKYEKLDKADKPQVIAKAPNGNQVKEHTVFQNTILVPGSTQRKWCDDDGNQYQKTELTFWFDGERIEENSQTKVMTIEGFQPLENYTDSYVISKYYELFPSTNDMKKDFDKENARLANLHGMRKMWEHLNDNKLVGRGEFMASSRGFISSDGYIRAVSFGNKWGLELGVFKEEKIFEHLNEDVPDVPAQQASTKRLKMV